MVSSSLLLNYDDTANCYRLYMSSEMIDKKFRNTHFPIEFCEMFGDCYAVMIIKFIWNE